MVQIISDSSTLYSVAEAKAIGLISCPLNVVINNKVYREFEDIDSKTFIDLVRAGNIPTTSQPSIGEKLSLYEAVSHDEEIIDISMADGLSGTYQTALGAKNMVEHNKRIHVLNAKTLCAPHRYIVNEALKLAKDGLSAEEIINKLEIAINDGGSFLIPMDFNFLKRGGRINAVAATIGSLIKIVPLMILSDDGKVILKHSIQKTIKKASDKIVEYLNDKGVNDDYFVAISHADNLDLALKMKAKLEEALKTEVQIYDLSPAFIAQGGPECVAVQWCHKIK